MIKANFSIIDPPEFFHYESINFGTEQGSQISIEKLSKTSFFRDLTAKLPKKYESFINNCRILSVYVEKKEEIK